jgi:membrane protein YdbS with pleckstrin-like domain
MTEPSEEQPAIPTMPPVASDSWRSFPAAAGRLATISGGFWGVLFSVGAAIFVGFRLLKAWHFLSPPWSLLLPAMLVLLAAGAGARLGYWRWKFSQWKLDDTGLHARRGRWWRKEILIPRSRVQHLDIERGPFERHFGLATVVVHTAGTRQHALRQSGFLDADAVALRDALVPASDRHDDVL